MADLKERLLAKCEPPFGLDLVNPDGPEAVARIEALEAVLQPFAKALADWGDEPEQNDRRNLWEHPAAIGIGLGDLRRAVQALQSEEAR